MNPLQVRGTWNIAKGKLKQKWASLIVDDLRFVDSKTAKLLELGNDSSRGKIEFMQNASLGFASESTTQSGSKK